MASVILNKQERLVYLKEIAARLAEEKAYIANVCKENDIAPIDADTDILSIENMQGFVMEGIQKVAVFIRKMPVIIL